MTSHKLLRLHEIPNRPKHGQNLYSRLKLFLLLPASRYRRAVHLYAIPAPESGIPPRNLKIPDHPLALLQIRHSVCNFPGLTPNTAALQPALPASCLAPIFYSKYGMHHNGCLLALWRLPKARRL